jgi:formylglycine-generating enzyme required for sulfatase activity
MHYISLLLRVLFLAILVTSLASFSNIYAQDKTFTNSFGMEFVLIEAGSFMMGADPNSSDPQNFVTPRHQVTISKPFYLGKFEITQQ